MFLPKASLTLAPKLKIFLLTLILFPCLVGLGIWQLQRAEEKQKLLDDQQLAQGSQALKLNNRHSRDLAEASKSPRTAVADGFFDAEVYWLLDNKIYRGQVGYEVLTPFYLQSIEPDRHKAIPDRLKVIIVNRGWVAGDPGRRQLPVLKPLTPPPDGVFSIKGITHVPWDNPLLDGSATTDEVNEGDRGSWPKIINEVDLLQLSKQTALSLPPWLLRLDADSPGALTIDWQPVNMSPEKHRAYAVQWFAMAFALALLCVWSSLKSSD